MYCLGKKSNGQPCQRKVNGYCHQHKPPDCSICLCPVDPTEDCQLVCQHAHHKSCLLQLLKAECPVCRGPLEFTQEMDITPIINNVNKEKQLQQEQQVQEDEPYARSLQENIIHEMIGDIIIFYF